MLPVLGTLGGVLDTLRDSPSIVSTVHRCSGMLWNNRDSNRNGAAAGWPFFNFVKVDRLRVGWPGEVPRGEKRLLSETDAESYITEYILAYPG